MHADTDAFVSALLIDTMMASSDGSVTPDGQHNFTSVSKKKQYRAGRLATAELQSIAFRRLR